MAGGLSLLGGVFSVPWGGWTVLSSFVDACDDFAASPVPVKLHNIQFCFWNSNYAKFLIYQCLPKSFFYIWFKDVAERIETKIRAIALQ